MTPNACCKNLLSRKKSEANRIMVEIYGNIWYNYPMFNKTPAMDEDAGLMLGLKDGDKSAFERLMDKYRKPLLNFACRYTGSRSDSEDIVQEVFLRIYRHSGNYRPAAKFSTWAYRITSNLCLDYLRKKRSRKNAGPEFSIDASFENDDGENVPVQIKEPSDSIEKFVEKKQRDELIYSSLGCLPENQRSALILRVYDQKSYSEIAEIMNCSVSSVESLIWRARQALKNKLPDIN